MTHSSQANSPRRLMKQSAFESPINDAHSSAFNACHITTPFATTAGKDAILSQRQRLRKTGPFVVHSQSIPDSRIKYAGSWPPKSNYESDSENNNTSAQQAATNGQKQVQFTECNLNFIH